MLSRRHTHRVNICQTFWFCTTINAHFNLIRMTCDDIQICVFFRWGFMLCTPHCLSQTFAFSRIWIEFLWIYQQSTVSARSAHFSALASMWEVLVGKHWDLQPRLPCLLPVQPGLFKICACGSFYYFDLYATGILMYWYLYLLKSLQSLQWICTGDTSGEEKKEARVKVMWKRCDPIHHYSDWDEYALGRLDSCSQGEGKKTIISLRRPGARNNRGVGKIGGMIGTNLFCDF